MLFAPTPPRTEGLKQSSLIGTLHCAPLFSGLTAENLATVASFTTTVSLAKDVETGLLNWRVKHEREAKAGTIPLRGAKRVLAAEFGTSSKTLLPTRLAVMLRHNLGEE